MQQEILDLKEVQKELELQNEIAKIFVTVPNGDMYSHILDVLLRVFHSKHGFIGYVDRKSRLVCPAVTGGVWERSILPKKEVVFPRDCWAGIWGESLVGQKVLYSNEPAEVPHGHIPINNSLCAPILHLGELIGCIAMGNKSFNYTERDVKIMKMVAARMAPLLHARLQRDDALESLQEAAHRAETYLKLAPAIFVALDKDGNITLLNDYGYKLLKCTDSLCIGKNWFDTFVRKENREEVITVFKNLMEGNVDHFEYENVIVDRNGSEKIVTWKNTVLRDEKGNITGTLSAGDDITDQREAEQELETHWESQEELLNKGLKNLSLLNGTDEE